MSDTENPVPSQPESAPTNDKSCEHGHGRWGRRHRGGPVRKGLGLLLFFGLLVGVPYAVANAAGFGGGHCGGGQSIESAGVLREHMDGPAGWVLNKVDASDEQTAQIDAVLDRVAPELFALKGDHEALRTEFRSALLADTINPVEIEVIRKDGMVLADDASKVILAGIIDVAKVLNAEQRTELSELAEKWHR